MPCVAIHARVLLAVTNEDNEVAAVPGPPIFEILEATDMPVCCRCNGSGRCMSCSCVKSGRPCVDCLPSRKGHCCNNAPMDSYSFSYVHS